PVRRSGPRKTRSHTAAWSGSTPQNAAASSRSASHHNQKSKLESSNQPKVSQHRQTTTKACPQHTTLMIFDLEFQRQSKRRNFRRIRSNEESIDGSAEPRSGVLDKVVSCPISLLLSAPLPHHRPSP